MWCQKVFMLPAVNLHADKMSEIIAALYFCTSLQVLAGVWLVENGTVNSIFLGKAVL
jgi:hypothetical protein